MLSLTAHSELKCHFWITEFKRVYRDLRFVARPMALKTNVHDMDRIFQKLPIIYEIVHDNKNENFGWSST